MLTTQNEKNLFVFTICNKDALEGKIVTFCIQMMSPSCRFVAITNKMVFAKNKTDVFTDILSLEIIPTRKKSRTVHIMRKAFVNLAVCLMGVRINIMAINHMATKFVKIIY